MARLESNPNIRSATPFQWTMQCGTDTVPVLVVVVVSELQLQNLILSGNKNSVPRSLKKWANPKALDLALNCQSQWQNTTKTHNVWLGRVCHTKRSLETPSEVELARIELEVDGDGDDDEDKMLILVEFNPRITDTRN